MYALCWNKVGHMVSITHISQLTPYAPSNNIEQRPWQIHEQFQVTIPWFVRAVLKQIVGHMVSITHISQLTPYAPSNNIEQRPWQIQKQLKELVIEIFPGSALLATNLSVKLMHFETQPSAPQHFLGRAHTPEKHRQKYIPLFQLRLRIRNALKYWLYEHQRQSKEQVFQ